MGTISGACPNCGADIVQDLQFDTAVCQKCGTSVSFARQPKKEFQKMQMKSGASYILLLILLVLSLTLTILFALGIFFVDPAMVVFSLLFLAISILIGRKGKKIKSVYAREDRRMFLQPYTDYLREQLKQSEQENADLRSAVKKIPASASKKKICSHCGAASTGLECQYCGMPFE